MLTIWYVGRLDVLLNYASLTSIILLVHPFSFSFNDICWPSVISRMCVVAIRVANQINLNKTQTITNSVYHMIF